MCFNQQEEKQNPHADLNVMFFVVSVPALEVSLQLYDILPSSLSGTMVMRVLGNSAPILPPMGMLSKTSKVSASSYKESSMMTIRHVFSRSSLSKRRMLL